MSAYEYQPSAPKKKSRVGMWIAIILVAIALLCGGGLAACIIFVNGTATQVEKDKRAKADDVKIIECNFKKATSDILPNVEVAIEVINGSDDQLTYVIDLFVFDANNNRVGNTSAIVTDVRPGQTVKETETIFLSEGVVGNITCKVDKVS